jgi:hypothetical protein
MEDLRAIVGSLPLGVISRFGSSPFYPVRVPDLIGVKGRRYLDSTGLQQHRSIVDLMRYAALNQGASGLACYDGFIPAGGPDYRTDPTAFTRYSDGQLYALALYIYSLKPPPNPNSRTTLAVQGEKEFEREGCPSCHTPALYTNNKLTPAEGFKIPEDHLRKYDISPVSGRDGSQSHDEDAAWHRLLQSSIIEGSLVSQHVRTQRLVRDARRLVRPAPPA